MPDIRYLREHLASGSRLRGFQDLVRHRVQDVLIVSSLYDSFILTADGQLDDLILREFLELNLPHAPSLTHVPTGAEALTFACGDGEYRGEYDLVIASMHVGDMDVLTLARKLREAGVKAPVVALAYDSQELSRFVRRRDVSDVDRFFLWQGDVRILLSIVNYVEDRLNVEHDTGTMGVQAIILVEDSIRFYSSFLPAIYAELTHHSQRLAPEGANLSQKLLRAQARPKILLSSTFEEAWQYFTAYEPNILGVISDVEFPWGGQQRRDAGVEFARKVRERQPDVPIILQSSNPANEALARSVDGLFLLKGSPVLLRQLRQFMIEDFGFGDFVFFMPDGTQVGRAHDLKGLEEMLRTVPAESVGYHSDRNHFSRWLKARTEVVLAHHLRPRLASDFASVEELRWSLVQSVQEYRDERKRRLVTDFERNTFDASGGFYRIGGGSLGGKARGLAFVNLLLSEHEVRDRFAGVRVSVPPSVVLGTDVFDEFLSHNDLRDFAFQAVDERQLLARFQAADFPEPVRLDLLAYLQVVDYPLAVRSSSLLEDSQHQPFAGVYETYMLPNTHSDVAVRLDQLLGAVKRVYASMFAPHAKDYLEATPYRLEEEKMAVILQRLVGAPHGDRFYPDFAGVARSHNFYPAAPAKAEDGVAAVALGLGMSVVDGESCVRFSPRYPRHVAQFSAVKDMLQDSQRRFHALQLDGHEMSSDAALQEYGLEAAEADGTLASLGSTYSSENDAVYDGIARSGVRLVTFASILKHRLFPLADILQALLDIGEQGTSAAVELEFAVNLSTARDRPKEFGFLQLRPLALSREQVEIELGDVDEAKVVCWSPKVLGNGKIDDVRDLVVVDIHRFDRGKSQEVASEVTRLNAELTAQATPYILIGVGRWGSRDPFLGIPVTWGQIAGARAIVEAGFKDFTVTPSQGSHFFQNLTSGNVGYFTVNPEVGEGLVDWGWLAAQPAVQEGPFTRHLRFEQPIVVKMDGRKSRGVILKPERGA